MPSFNLQMGGTAPSNPMTPNQQGPVGRNFFGNNQTPTGPISPSQALMNQYKLYNTGVEQSANQYDTINQGYQNLANPVTPLASRSFNPTTTNYTPTADQRSSTANLQDLSKTGGYSPQDIADLRARGISPIRAVYANAQRNIDRQRSLQGGYSPNYTAATAKMSRDLSQGISDATQNVNAQLAQAIVGNRMNIAPVLANTVGRESELENSYNAQNANTQNAAQQFNIGNELDINKYNQNSDLQRKLSSLEGMRSLYGTTPALAALFGQQAMSAANLAQDDTRNTLNTGTNLARVMRG